MQLRDNFTGGLHPHRTGGKSNCRARLNGFLNGSAHRIAVGTGESDQGIGFFYKIGFYPRDEHGHLSLAVQMCKRQQAGGQLGSTALRRKIDGAERVLCAPPVRQSHHAFLLCYFFDAHTPKQQRRQPLEHVQGHFPAGVKSGKKLIGHGIYLLISEAAKIVVSLKFILH